MKIKTLLFILLLILLTGAVGYTRIVLLPEFQAHKAQLETSPSPSSVVTVPSGPSPNELVFSAEVEKVYRQLSADEQVAQVMAVPLRVGRDTQSTQFIASQSAGVVVLFGENIATSSAVRAIQQVKRLHSLHQTLPPLFAVDHEGGSVQRLRGSGFTRIPSWQVFCKSTDEEKGLTLAQSAHELHQIGIDIVFGPVVDVRTTETNQATQSGTVALGDRLCSDDPYTVLQNSEFWILLFEREGITSVLKHYPGIGQAKNDLHDAFETIEVPPAEQKIFTDLLQAHQNLGIMTTFVGTTDSPTQPCALNTECLKKLTTTKRQLIFTDGLEMVSAGYNGGEDIRTLGERAVAAIEAGNTVVLFSQGITLEQLEEVKKVIQEKAAQSPEFRQKLELAAKKVINKKLLRQGL